MSERLVLFVHGLGGKPEATWGAFHSLLKSDPEVSGADVDYFSYPTSLFRWPFSRKAPRVQTLAGALQTLIENRFRNHHNITLVCHSLGGLIAKQYLIDQIEQQHRLRVRSLLLYAVPNNGTALAAVAAFISWRHGQLRQLCQDSDLVTNIATAWSRREMAGKVDVRYVVAGQDRIVDEHSARDSWGNIAVEVIADRDHRSIVKPQSPTDLSYLILKNMLTPATSAAGSTVSEGATSGAPGLAAIGVPSAPQSISPQQDIRVAMSALIRIASGDRYILVRNLHRPETFAPIGGVYKYFQDGQSRLDGLEFRPQSIDAEMVNDVRGFLPYKHLNDFIRWFQDGHGRESASECLHRELQEEMAEAGLQSQSDEISGVRFVQVRTINEGPEAIAAEHYLQFRIFEVYDLVAASSKGAELIRRLEAHATLGGEMIWVTSQEIIRGRDRNGHVVGAHTPYLFGHTRYRSQDPAFAVG